MCSFHTILFIIDGFEAAFRRMCGRKAVALLGESPHETLVHVLSDCAAVMGDGECGAVQYIYIYTTTRMY